MEEIKLYHIDRSGTINVGQVLELQKNIHFENEANEKCLSLVMPYYDAGLSHHGIQYLLTNNLFVNEVMPLGNVMDIIFEYERLLNYTDKLSRYQSFFAFDSEGVQQFINNHHLSNSFYKIYEVKSNYVEKHNMTLISGTMHYNIAAMAKIYWENGDDPYDRPVVNEYLLKYPIQIIREVTLEDLK